MAHMQISAELTLSCLPPEGVHASPVIMPTSMHCLWIQQNAASMTLGCCAAPPQFSDAACKGFEAQPGVFIKNRCVVSTKHLLSFQDFIT